MKHENEAAACFVVIRGALSHEWCDYLGELTISSHPTSSHPAEGEAATILAGQMVDFAAFVGLISRLQNLGLTVQAISFHRLPAAPLA